MAGGVYIEPYPRDEPCEKHEENIAIICEPGTECFGEPLIDLICRVCSSIDGYEDSIVTCKNEEGLDLFEASRPVRGTEREDQLHAQKMLLTHSLWLIDHNTILKESSWVPLTYQVANLPDESKVYTWIPNDHPQIGEIRRDIRSQFDKIKIATSRSEMESKIEGYLGYQVNPDGSEATVIEWSHKVANKIDDLD